MLKGICLSMVGLFMLCSFASADLVDNNNGTVTDTNTGLMWQQTETSAMTWEAALDYCETLELAGLSDWRLPNRNELHSIVDYGTSYPSTNTVFFPGAESLFYWSSTTYIDITDVAWYVNFRIGNIFGGSKSDSNHVRAVRGGQ